MPGGFSEASCLLSLLFVPKHSDSFECLPDWHRHRTNEPSVSQRVQTPAVRRVLHMGCGHANTSVGVSVPPSEDIIRTSECRDPLASWVPSEDYSEAIHQNRAVSSQKRLDRVQRGTAVDC